MDDVFEDTCSLAGRVSAPGSGLEHCCAALRPRQLRRSRASGTGISTVDIWVRALSHRAVMDLSRSVQPVDVLVVAGGAGGQQLGAERAGQAVRAEERR